MDEDDEEIVEGTPVKHRRKRRKKSKKLKENVDLCDKFSNISVENVPQGNSLSSVLSNVQNINSGQFNAYKLDENVPTPIKTEQVEYQRTPKQSNKLKEINSEDLCDKFAKTSSVLSNAQNINNDQFKSYKLDENIPIPSENEQVQLSSYCGIADPLYTIPRNCYTHYVFYLIDEILKYSPNKFPRNCHVHLIGTYQFCSSSNEHFLLSFEVVYGQNNKIKLDFNQIETIPIEDDQVLIFGTLNFDQSVHFIRVHFYQSNTVNNHKNYSDHMRRLRDIIPLENTEIISISDKELSFGNETCPNNTPMLSDNVTDSMLCNYSIKIEPTLSKDEQEQPLSYCGIADSLYTIPRNSYTHYVFYLIEEILKYSPNKFPRNCHVHLIGTYQFCSSLNEHFLSSFEVVYGQNSKIKLGFDQVETIPIEGDQVLIFGTLNFDQSVHFIRVHFYQSNTVNNHKNYSDHMRRLRDIIPLENTEIISVPDNELSFVNETLLNNTTDAFEGLPERISMLTDTFSDSMLCEVFDEVCTGTV